VRCWEVRDVIAEREKRREQFRRDAEAARPAYQADGLHLTAEEADSWLKTLEAGEDAPPPECHG
jgi:predicted transcriptional regulator